MTHRLVDARCPVCAGTMAAKAFDGGHQPLATLGWPMTAQDAQVMTRLPLDYVQCCRCTHVWNRAFDYDAIPYQSNPNRMFNKGGIWGGHLAKVRDLLLDRLGPAPCVVEIGCGEGHFLRGLAQVRPQGRYIGFDPNGEVAQGHQVEFHQRLFAPLQDMPALVPDAIVIRHVLEHLTEPAALIEQMAWAASLSDRPCLLLAEVPCIDRAFEAVRSTDFFYEHVAQFTSQSFETLMRRGGAAPEILHGYDGEVVFGFVVLQGDPLQREQAQRTRAFADAIHQGRINIRVQIDELAASGRRVAIWGGTGKAAAFMHYFEVDAVRFPLVVDSDPEKVGSYVPGTGQQIQYRDVLKDVPADVVIIPAQWRAADIVAEMGRHGIEAPTVLIEHQGHLIDFRSGRHPYAR